MRSDANLVEPEPRRKAPQEKPTQVFWRPSLPEAKTPPAERPVPYLLAPAPWPQGQFKIDPEA